MKQIVKLAMFACIIAVPLMVHASTSQNGNLPSIVTIERGLKSLGLQIAEPNNVALLTLSQTEGKYDGNYNIVVFGKQNSNLPSVQDVERCSDLGIRTGDEVKIITCDGVFRIVVTRNKS